MAEPKKIEETGGEDLGGHPDVATEPGVNRPATDAPEPHAPSKPSLWRMLLWSSLELDDSEMRSDVVGLAAGVALASACGVLFLLATEYERMRFVELFAILAGFGVAVAGTFDVVARRPSQLLVPLAQVLVFVLGLVLAERSIGGDGAARSALAWSLGLHFCVFPITTRLWAVYFSQGDTSANLVARRELFEAAKSGERDTLLVRVLEFEGIMATVESVGPTGRGTVRVPESMLGNRAKSGRFYAMSGTILIQRLAGAGQDTDDWVRYLVGVDDVVCLGDRPEVDDDEVVSPGLARRALVTTLAISVVLTALAAAASV